MANTRSHLLLPALERSKGSAKVRYTLKGTTVAGWRETSGEDRGSVKVVRQKGQFTIISKKRRKCILLTLRGF